VRSFTRQLALIAVLGGLYAPAQTLDLKAPHAKDYVSYIAQPATVEAGKPADVQLYFRVVDAIHINSHNPFASELIPTTLTLQAAPDVKLGRMVYPAGTKYAFDFAPNEKLSVYTGDFVVNVRVIATHAGSYTLNGALRYQACDNMQCYPPKTVPVTVFLTVK